IEKEEKLVSELKQMLKNEEYKESSKKIWEELFNKDNGKAQYHFVNSNTNEIIRDLDAEKSELLRWVTVKTHEYGITAYPIPVDGVEYSVSPVVPMNLNSFEDAIISLQKILKERGATSHEYLEQIRRIYDKFKWFDSALSDITLEEIEKMKYRPERVKAHQGKRIPADKKAKLVIELRKVFCIGDVILSSEVKEKLTRIYSDLGIVKVKPKATDLGEYFQIKNSPIRS